MKNKNRFINKILAIVTLLTFIPSTTFAANTQSLSLTAASSQYAGQTSSNLGIGGSANFSMEAWVRIATVPGYYTVAMLADASTGVSHSIFISSIGGVAATTYIRYYKIRHGITAPAADYTIGNIVGTWVHIVTTYDGTNMRLYTALQGGTHTLRATTASSGNGNVNNTYTGTHIGAEDLDDNSSFAAADYMDGLIDDVRMWNTVLSTSDMDTNFEKELAGNETGLIGYWKLNNGYTDSQTNTTTHDLTAVNSPTFSSTVPFTGSTPSTPDQQSDFLDFSFKLFKHEQITFEAITVTNNFIV